MGLLEIVATDLCAGYMRGDSKDGYTAALTIKEPVDEMQVAGTTTCCANGEFSGEVSLRSGCEGCGFFVPDVFPLDGSVPAQGIGEAVERVAGQSIHPFDACVCQGLNDDIGDCFGHGALFLVSFKQMSSLLRNVPVPLPIIISPF